MSTEAISLWEADSSRATATRMCTTSLRMLWILHSIREALGEEEGVGRGRGGGKQEKGEEKGKGRRGKGGGEDREGRRGGEEEGKEREGEEK